MPTVTATATVSNVGKPPRPNDPHYHLACELEKLAVRMEKAGTRCRKVAVVGMSLLRKALHAGVLDRLNEMSDIANGEYGGALSERTLDRLFEDDDVRDHLVPMFLKEMAHDPMLATEAEAYFGARTLRRWQDEFMGSLFGDENVLFEREAAREHGIEQTKHRLIAGIDEAAKLPLDF